MQMVIMNRETSKYISKLKYVWSLRQQYGLTCRLTKSTRKIYINIVYKSEDIMTKELGS